MDFDLVFADISGFIGNFCGKGDVPVGDGDFVEDSFAGEDGCGLSLWCGFAVVEGEFDVFARGGWGFDKDFDGFLKSSGFGIFVIFWAEDFAAGGFIDLDLEALGVDRDVDGVGEIGLAVGGGEFELEDVGAFGEGVALEGEFGGGEVDFSGSTAVGGEGDFAIGGGVLRFSTEGELKAGGLGVFVLLGVEAFLSEADKLDCCGSGGGTAATVASGGRSCEQDQE